MSSPSPAVSPPANATSPPPPPPPAPTATAPAPSNATTQPSSSPPPPVAIDSPPSPATASFDSPPPPATASFDSPPPPPPPGSGSLPRGTLAGIIVGIGIGGMSMLVAVGLFVVFYRRWKRKKMREQGLDYNSHGNNPPDPKSGPPQNNTPPGGAKFAMYPPPAPPAQVISSYSAGSASYSSGSDRPPPPHYAGVAFGLSQCTFTYEELVRATGGFSRDNLLGQGGFGYVYKGVLPNGKVVAVKQLKAGSGQGEREFQAEVEVISRVHHRHLVSLVGYCISGDQRMLVYEFVPNNTLEFHLHGNGKPTMNWTMRMKVAQGSAKGLAYLHEDCQPKIIHRDIKAANILIDHEFEAKVADFGLAKFSLDTETHVSTRIMGTIGYLAPEYASSGKLTDKSDVFSFGVMLLELITGRRPIDKKNTFSDDSMVEWARPLLKEALETGNFNALVDPKLQNNYNPSEVKRMVACAAACVRHSARIRPRMSQIVRALEGNISLDELNEGSKPGHSTVYGSYGSQEYKSSEYRHDMEKFRKLALESQEQTTSEYSVPSTGSGLNPSAWSSSTGQTTEEIEPEKTTEQNQRFR